MEAQVKEILALDEGVSVSKKELSNEEASKLVEIASNKENAQPAELVHLLDTIDALANACMLFSLLMLTFSPSPEDY